MQTITVNMQDLWTGKTVTREIDISVIYVNGAECWEVAQSQEKREELINEWIKDRANDQHETELELIDFTIQ